MKKSALLMLLYLLVLPNNATSQERGVSACEELGTNTKVTVLVACIGFLKNAVARLQNESESLKEIAMLSGVPKGAVLAFDVVHGCPSGWTRFTSANGRVIIGVGAGNADAKGQLLSERRLSETGGEETVVLTTDEMPRHNHGGETGTPKPALNYFHRADGHFDSQLVSNPRTGEAFDNHTDHTHEIAAEGGDTPHNNMPPYIALYLCKKD